MAKEILIADSDRGDQEEFKKIFEMKEYKVIFSESGEDALEQVKFFKPDLIIADTALSDKGGLQICSALKADREFKHIPIVLLKGTFEGISERDLEHARADGVISKPIHEGEIVGLVDRLMEEGAMKTKTESLLEDLDKFDDEQIIELTDVVEEPESRVRIDDLMASEKEESPAGSEKEEVPGEIADLVSLEKQLESVTQPLEEELSLSSGEAIKEEVKPKAAVPSPPKEAKGEELFEKVALEEIFLKMEQIKPAIEKELLGEEEVHIAEEAPSAIAETVEKPFSLEEFEAALEKEPMPKPEEKMVQPIMPKPPERKALSRDVLHEIPPFDLPDFEIPTKEEAKKVSVEVPWGEEVKEVKEESLEEVVPSKSLPEEEELTMEALEQALGPLVRAEAKRAVIPEPSAKEVTLEEKPLAELVEEEFTQELLVGAEVAKEEALEEKLPKVLLEEERKEETVTALEEPERKEIEEIEQVMEEVVAPMPLQAEEIRVAEMPLEQKVTAPEGMPPFRRPIEKGAPKLQFADQQLEAIIAKGVQAMMEDILTKIVPEMTQNIVGVTMDRIEKMVKEIVPEMAEKAIQEEIKRLQEEEKE